MNLLDIPMQENDANASTIREYLKALLYALWDEGEGFSGKRPFGNSDWEHEPYNALVKAKAVDGIWNEEYNCADRLDYAKANKLIFKAIGDLK